MVSADNCEGIHHVALVVSDIYQAIEFYSAAFDGAVIKLAAWEVGEGKFDALTVLHQSSAKFCLMRFANSYIEIFEYSTGAASSQVQARADMQGIRHIAFQVKDLERTFERVCQAGGRSVGESIHVAGGGAARYCEDPFGNIIELLVPGGKMPPLEPR